MSEELLKWFDRPVEGSDLPPWYRPKLGEQVIQVTAEPHFIEVASLTDVGKTVQKAVFPILSLDDSRTYGWCVRMSKSRRSAYKQLVDIAKAHDGLLGARLKVSVVQPGKPVTRQYKVELV